MKPSVSLSRRAEVDLTNQYRWYSEHAGADVAERFLTTFDVRVKLLAGYPELGRPCRFRSPELKRMRSFSVGGRFGDHLIFYRILEDGVTIDPVMHGSRDLERRLPEK